MMTSSNGNISRVTGHLCGEFTGHRWIPRTKASDAELWFFSLICSWINGWVNDGEAGDFRRHRAHYDVTVMKGWCTWILLWTSNVHQVKYYIKTSYFTQWLCWPKAYHVNGKAYLPWTSIWRLISQYKGFRVHVMKLLRAVGAVILNITWLRKTIWYSMANSVSIILNMLNHHLNGIITLS